MEPIICKERRLVAECVVLLYANSTRGNKGTQSSRENDVKQRIYCSKVCFFLSICPLVCGWYAENKESYIFKISQSALQILDVNWTPWSKTMLAGVPWSLMISFTKTCAVSNAEGVSFIGRKRAILEKWSMTKMAEYPSDGGSSTKESMAIIFQGLSGIGRGLCNPQALLLLLLLWLQVTQEFT